MTPSRQINRDAHARPYQNRERFVKKNAPQLFMNVLSRNWLSRKGAAEKLDVSVDTIERRAIPWQDEPVPGKLRYKHLKLGEETRQERRYCEEDLEALLVP
jgi:hypothetical protein